MLDQFRMTPNFPKGTVVSEMSKKFYTPICPKGIIDDTTILKNLYPFGF
jgi:hypothetical protein